MQVERWSKLAPEAIRAEVLEEWGVAVAERRTEPLSPSQEELAQQLEDERSRREELEWALAQAQERLTEAEQSRVTIEALRGDLTRERHRREKLEQQLADATVRIAEWDRRLERA